MSAPDNDTVTTAEATSDAVLPQTGGSGDPALPDADEISSDAVVETVDVRDEDDEDEDEDEDEDDDDEDGSPDTLLVREGDVAGDYLERLLDILDVDGDIDLDVEGDRASVAVVGGELRTLIGPDGATLEALQELTRLAVAQSTGVRSRLMLDIGGFRAKRRADLTSLATAATERVGQSRQPERLSPMNPFERKVVHDVVAAAAGVRSESEGEEPNRRVVVLPDA
ncbi:spoIIIJ-associated protein [Modestobacter sp. DSM 44400]|uniref:Jag family protein n=1 Tax=Modestobacter sp. DSM 44400 TaxID=1550230 RepID=UPI00089726AF|nr:R3H domain-containing nucleic acid-binding protein [Modestobacter sp. DSM 44400]SDY23228.1 spoIIIJ-associated protein [Modestobacter sp. DSM 44400]